jgi:CheY-like chemotaxis protein
VATFTAANYGKPLAMTESHELPSQDKAQGQPAAQAQNETSAHEGRVEQSRAKAKILVADDNEMNALALEDYLTAVGYELYFAADGEQALAYAEEIGPDLILMDIQMPKISGVEATRRLRKNPRFANTPILALTALAMPGDRELCLAAGASAYISKPFLLKDLVRVIEEWLQRE